MNENMNQMLDSIYSLKAGNFHAANSNTPNVLYQQGLYPQIWKNRYGELSLITTPKFVPQEWICVTYLWTEEESKASNFDDKAYDIYGNQLWFKKGKFPININGETNGELLDGTSIKVTTLIDTGCSKPILNKRFYDRTPFLHQFPKYPLKSLKVIAADDGVIEVTEAIHFMTKFHGHVFEFIAYLANMCVSMDFVTGQKSLFELEAGADFSNLPSHFMNRSSPVYAVDDFTVNLVKQMTL